MSGARNDYGIDYLDREIAMLLAYNPPALIPHPKSPCPKLTAPLSFYHKHLDDRLTLKRVILASSLTTDLSDLVDRTLRRLNDDKTRLLPLILPNRDAFATQKIRNTRRPQNPMEDARAIGDAYKMDTATSCKTLASMFSLHPHAKHWSCILAFNPRTIGRQHEFYALYESLALAFHTDFHDNIEMDDIVLTSLDSDARENLQQAALRFPRLAVWQFYFISQEAEGALKALDTIASQPAFKHERYSTLGFKTPQYIIPHFPDALEGLPSIAAPSLPARSETSDATSLKPEIVSSRRSARVMTKGHTKLQSGRAKTRPKYLAPSTKAQTEDEVRRWTDVTLPSGGNSATTESPEALAAALIQHAWFRAIQEDASFVILHSGNYERIGYRQRSTQTLYISELIDVPHCSDPAYGKLHVGLHTSIVDDVLDRTRQLVKLEKDACPMTSKKRGRGNVDSPEVRKRPKTRAFVAKEAALKLQRMKTYKDVVQESASRSLALLRIQHGHFNSPAPASFLRVDAVRQPTYTPQEYFTLTITAEIGMGAIGDVHAAKLELLTVSGKLLQIEVVVKIAFDPAQRKRMLHEFAVYEHLMSSNVKGIPNVFGLFEDVETKALALVMDHVGLNVWERRPDKKKFEYAISESEGAAFIDVLKDIHRAGVRHRDLRPENLTVNDDGTVSIIDFDQAELNAGEGSRARELNHLTRLIDGDYVPPGDVPSLRTPGKYRSPSNSGSNHTRSSSTSASSASASSTSTSRTSS